MSQPRIVLGKLDTGAAGIDDVIAYQIPDFPFTATLTDEVDDDQNQYDIIDEETLHAFLNIRFESWRIDEFPLGNVATDPYQ